MSGDAGIGPRTVSTSDINGCQTALTTQSKKPEQDLHRSEKLGAAEAHIGTVKGLTTRFASVNFACNKGKICKS